MARLLHKSSGSNQFASLLRDQATQALTRSAHSTALLQHNNPRRCLLLFPELLPPGALVAPCRPHPNCTRPRMNGKIWSRHALLWMYVDDRSWCCVRLCGVCPPVGLLLFDEFRQAQQDGVGTVVAAMILLVAFVSSAHSQRFPFYLPLHV